ncbi:hypothetical protein SAMN04488564_103399 [Lentzea waywayandensis]|uniref:DUF4232 domain-containing protein n=1 Tax=Lentzea waywayandensis TaxID=84724 RepID=A0A1I6DYN9_9PSEU|nr:hypothetical protein [Lentzea waywayandensis]SFR10441.1 hypothetical protein SAMN04488564_103399 [Lentzea waywayandensis]
MNKIRLTAVALAGATLLTVAGTPAQAETPWCTGSDLVVSAHDMRSPSSASKAHQIRFAAAEGVSCTIGGSLSDVRFLDADGEDLGIEPTVQSGEYVEVPVGGYREAAVYVASQIHGPRVTPASIRITLPGQDGPGDSVTVAWPSNLSPVVRLGSLTAPVS